MFVHLLLLLAMYYNETIPAFKVSHAVNCDPVCPVHRSSCHERDNGGGVGLQACLIVTLVDACLR
jgi:hypothetical protein